MSRGKESLRLGYTVSQVVHGYGSICQAITEYFGDHSKEAIKPREFNRLNFCLDVAIAEAVTEFTEGQKSITTQAEVVRLGSLAHELRNALASAIAAHRMIQRGVVRFGGNTGKILETSLATMKELIDRSLTEVRLQGEPAVERNRFRLVDLVSEVEVLAALEASSKAIEVSIEVPPDLVVEVDHHLIVSAMSNLLQNAIKFTRENGRILLRAYSSVDRILLEIQDECGGLPEGKSEELFTPFVQKGKDTSGVGLGLAISKSAVTVCGGRLSVKNIPGKGCVFTIDLPKY